MRKFYTVSELLIDIDECRFQFANKFSISVLEAKASKATGDSGHEAPPITHFLVF